MHYSVAATMLLFFVLFHKTSPWRTKNTSLLRSQHMQSCLPLFTLVAGADGRIIAHNIGLQSVLWHLKEPGMCHLPYGPMRCQVGAPIWIHIYIYICTHIYIYMYVWTGYPCHSLPKLLVWLKHISPAKYMQTGILGIETDSSGVLV